MPEIQSRTVHAAVAMALAAAVGPAHAQSTTAGSDQPLEQIVVQGQIVYRDRAETPRRCSTTTSNTSSGSSRSPSATCSSGCRASPSCPTCSNTTAAPARLDPGYTQILINGSKMPGAGADRSFFVDRIPAELVERIEIVRSPSANRSGEGAAARSTSCCATTSSTAAICVPAA